MGQGGQQWIATLVSVVVLVVVLTLRMRKMRQARPLKVEKLWMLPAFYGAIVVALYAVHPPQGLIWIYALAALAVGSALGWFRGKLMSIHVDPETHELSQQGSVAAMLFILVLVALRMGTRFYAESNSGIDPTAMISLTDVLLAFGFGFIGAQRLEMGLRAKALLEQARARSR
jgi:CDP-diglyceride synthetase